MTGITEDRALNTGSNRNHGSKSAWPGRAPLSPPRAIVVTEVMLQSMCVPKNPGPEKKSGHQKKMLELNQRPTISTMQYRTGSRSQQPRRLLLALVLLVVALVGLLVKDRQFWFGTERPTIESDVEQPTAAPQAPATTAARRATSPATTSAKKKVHVATVAAEAKPADAPVVATNRTTLPPLDVEVVAGDKHHKLHPGTNVTHVELPNSAPVENAASATNAAEREALPAAAAQQASVNAPLPMLAQHMNVQGSVVLQAVISADGVIEDLRVLSGPAILSAAAQQAVREWRFKPMYQNGQAVESKAKITVNFSIKVADTMPKATLADSRTSDQSLLNR